MGKILGILTIPFSLFNLILMICGVSINGSGFLTFLLLLSMVIGGIIGIVCGNGPMALKGITLVGKSFVSFLIGFFTILFSALSLKFGTVIATTISWLKAILDFLRGVLLLLATFAFPTVGVYFGSFLTFL